MSAADQYREWLGRFPAEPADRMATALAAIEAFEACERKPDLAEADLQPLVAAATSTHKRVVETGCKLLVQLALRHPAARECLLQMARSKDAAARFHAVAYLHGELPETLRLEIVGLALRDRSAKVRKKGIERAEQFRFRGFLPLLQEMERMESHAGVRASLDLHLPLLRDGYRLQPAGSGQGYYLTVRGPNSLGGPFIPNEKYSDEFVRQEVARLQSAL